MKGRRVSLRRVLFTAVWMVGVIVAQIQSSVVTEHESWLRLEREDLAVGVAAGLLLDQLLHLDVVEAHHGLAHGVVGGVDVHAQPREAAVKVSRQVVSVNVITEHCPGRQQVTALLSNLKIKQNMNFGLLQ